MPPGPLRRGQLPPQPGQMQAQGLQRGELEGVPAHAVPRMAGSPPQQGRLGRNDVLQEFGFGEDRGSGRTHARVISRSESRVSWTWWTWWSWWTKNEKPAGEAGCGAWLMPSVRAEAPPSTRLAGELLQPTRTPLRVPLLIH